MDFDTREQPESFFDEILEETGFKSCTYWLDEKRNIHREYDPDNPESVRFQVKIKPTNVKTPIPSARGGKPFGMTHYRKTVVYRLKDQKEWKHAMHRNEAKSGLTW